MILQLPEGMGLLDGDFGNGFFAMAGLLDGDFWCLTGDETYLVYRDNADGVFNYAVPCAMYKEGDATVAIVVQALDNDTWLYCQKGISPAGSICQTPSGVLSVAIDVAGDLSHDPGNEPVNVTAIPLSGARIQVRWKYDATGHQATPTGFYVYRWDDPAWTLVATLAFSRARWIEYISGTLTHGTEYTFKVCTYRTILLVTTETTGVQASATADNVGPALIDSLTMVVA